MLELYRVLQPWEYGQGTKYNFDTPLSLIEEFDDEDPFFADKDLVVKFCDEYVEDLRNNAFTCMSDYILYEDNFVLKIYKSRSEQHIVSWVYPHPFDLIQVNDRCYLNRQHRMIQFPESGDLYIYQSIQDDRSSYLLHRLGCMQDKVIITIV